MYCQNCGKKLHDSAVICPQCGVAVGRGVHVAAPGKINGMGLAGFVLSLAAVLVLALFHSAFCAVIVLPAFALSLCGTMQCSAGRNRGNTAGKPLPSSALSFRRSCWRSICSFF